jgi:hypothetical protein
LANGHGELSKVLHLANDDPQVERLQAELLAALGRHQELSADQRAAALVGLLRGLLEAKH